MAVKTSSLATRIMVVIALMVTVVASAYCFALWYGIDTAEQTLIGQAMERRLKWVVEGAGSDHRPMLPADRIYAQGPQAGDLPPIPEAYRNAPSGFSEIVGREDFFLYRLDRDGTTWILERSQYGFEDVELGIYGRAVGGLIAALLAAMALSLWLARTIALPIRRLSLAVARRRSGNGDQPLEIGSAPQEITELAAVFEFTFRQLHETLQREKAFTADVSHELRTPLTVISTSAELLNLKVEDPAAKTRLEAIHRACLRLNRLLGVFLELARGENGRQLSATADLDVLIDTVAANWRPEADKKHIRLIVDAAPEAAREVPAALTESLLDNLIRNAVQYTDVGSITLSADGTTISVADTGRGIRDEEKGRILNAFVRGDTAPGEGYGWGLSLVRRICQHEGWTLGFRRNEPRGTVFIVALDGRPLA